MLIPFGLSAQNEDKINHFAAETMISFGTTGMVYKLSTKTDLNLWVCKISSTLIGFGTGVLIGHLKEQYDSNNGGYYNDYDMEANIIGAGLGSVLMFTIMIPAIPEDRVPKEDAFDIFPLLETNKN